MTDIQVKPPNPSSGLSGVNQTRPPLYRNVTVVKWFAQLVTLAIVIFALWFFASVAGDNLALRDISTSFDFLSVDPGLPLSDTIDPSPDTGGRALWAGMVNTLRLAAVGIIFATLLGILVGLARLSNNWIVNKVGTVFVEVLRNIPLLVLMIVMEAIFLGIQGSVSPDMGPINGWLHISNKGISIPRVHIDDGFYQWAVFLLIGSVFAWFAFRWRSAVQDSTGKTGYPWLTAIGVMAVFGIIGWFKPVHSLFSGLDKPLQAISDGIQKIPEFTLQVVLTIAALAFAANWIRRFLNARRTPAGLARLTDDDRYQIIFAGFVALAAGFVLLRLWPGFSSWIINSSSDLFGVLADKFEPVTGVTAEGEEFVRDRNDGRPIGMSSPDFTEGRFVNYGPSGLNMSKGFAVVFLSVWLNTAAFIGEVVRGGILAVSKGQTEAAAALGLKRSQQLRQVILPQAFRVVLPPLGNNYLNLTKNTSLAFTVGFFDFFNTQAVLANQTGRVIPTLIITMLFYLACSLVISVVVNFFNVRLKIVER